MFKKLKSNRGFTIIEVLIVLAIAGLIMLIVFLAVPALQRNQRNTARTDEAARVAAAVTECLANRNGTKTSCDDDTEIEQGTTVQLTSTLTFADGGATAPVSSITGAGVWYQRVCLADGSGSTATGATTRTFAVLYTIEPAITRCIAG